MAGQKGASGGARIGAGRKPTSALRQVITGYPGHRGRVLHGPGLDEPPVPAPVAAVEAPSDLGPEARAVWACLAPHACQARTLTRATALGFGLLCETVVLERQYSARLEARGGPSHRALIQRVEGGLAAFGLRPFGKPLDAAAPPAPVNPLDRFLTRAKA
jgi:hypothetical protein